MAMPRRWPKGYYTYIFFEEDVPRYVGAGKNNRARPGRVFKDESRILTIVYEQEDKSSAFIFEEQLIRQFGRQDLGTGTLLNRNYGLGGRGRVLSAEARERISQAQRGKKHTETTREKHRQRMLGNTRLLGYKHSEETRVRISVANSGRKLVLKQEERQRRADAVRTRPQNQKGYTRCS